MKRKLYLVGNASDYINWMESEMTSDMKEADFVVFTGGSDVDSSFYNEQMGMHTCSNIRRDVFEKREFEKALALKKPMLGICRGSQFLCVMAGGKLVQHQNSTGGIHPIITHDGKELKVTSSHHQAMYPWGLGEGNFRVLGWTEDQSETHLNGNDQEMEIPEGKEVEVAYFPKIRAYGIQSHPEWMFTNLPEDKKTIDYFRNHLNLLIEGNLEKELASFSK